MSHHLRRGFTQLYEQQYVRVYRFVLRRVDNDADAADLTAETFRRAWERSLSVAKLVTPAWLFVTARNTVGDLYRSRERQQGLFEIVSFHSSLTGSPNEFSEVYAALEALSAEDRELLKLRYWDELTVDEIAGVLGPSSGALWVRLHRVRKRFSAHLARELEGTAS